MQNTSAPASAAASISGRTVANDQMGHRHLTEPNARILVRVLRLERGPEQQLDRSPAELDEVLRDRGQRRCPERGQRMVVEAHHADVFGHAQTPRLQRPDHPKGDLVVATENRGDVVPPGQPQIAQAQTGLVPGCGAPIGRHHLRRLDPGLGQRILPAQQAPADVAGGGGRDMLHRAMSQPEQIPGGLRPAAAVVEEHVGHVFARGRRDHRQRHGVRDPLDGPRAGLVELQNDHARHRLAERQVHGLAQLLPGGRPDDGDRRDPPGGPGRLLDALDRGGVAVLEGVAGEHADQRGATGDERQGGRVRVVAERFHRFENDFATLLADLGGAVEHPRHGRHGNPGDPRNIRDARPPRLPLHGLDCNSTPGDPSRTTHSRTRQPGRARPDHLSR
jgi:hypothetical protein